MKVKHILLAAMCCTMTLGTQAQNRAAAAKTFTRKVLIEKHTGVMCGNCPEADYIMSNYLASHGHGDKVIEIRHNSYQPYDQYFVPMHLDVARMWGMDVDKTGVGNHWPTFYVDRCNHRGDTSAKPHDYGYSRGEFGGDSDQVGARLAKKSNVSVLLSSGTYNPATRTLNVRVTGEVTTTLPDLHINIFLVQDDASYKGTTFASLTNNVNGDWLPVSGGRYDVLYTYTIPDKIRNVKPDPSNVRIVAFVSSFNEKDFTISEVHNCEEVWITSLPNTAPRPRLTCAAPTISLNGQQLHFESNTPGAVYFYNVTSNASADLSTAKDADLSKATFTVTASAGAPGYNNSAEVTKTFTLLDLIGDKKDVNGDGTISVTDIPSLIKLMKR